jgi:hypothetical protein
LRTASRGRQSIDAAGAGTGKARKKAGRQAFVILQDEGLAAMVRIQPWHGALHISIYDERQHGESFPLTRQNYPEFGNLPE